MGNRAIITLQNEQGKTHPVALYLHWNGGLESVEAFMEVAHNTPKNRSGLYDFHLTLCQLIRNYFKDGCSFYAYPLKDVRSLSGGCCNGHFHYQVGKDVPKLKSWSRQPEGKTLDQCVKDARSHAYWTDQPNIISQLQAVMPSTSTKFEVQHYTLCDGWLNTWYVCEDGIVESKQVFASEQEAQAELDEFLAEIADEIKRGERKPDNDYDPAHFRIVPIII